MKHNGYGLSIIGRLKESRVKRNLYYEIKDKVVEEVMQNGKPVRVTRKTKCFGLHSNHEIRNLLIEILRERMNFHKDKFISPTLYEEMRGLEVKRNGKVEHSDLTHDDQIFSYLMALYVWYEGKNLREDFGIEKSGIKTEESIDEEIELVTGPGSGVDMTKAMAAVNRPPDAADSILTTQLAQLAKAKGLLFSEFVEQQRKADEEHLKQLLMNPKDKEAYARFYGVSPDSVDVDFNKDSFSEAMSNLPDSVFLDFNVPEEELSNNSIYRTLNSSNMNPEYSEREMYEDSIH